MQRYSFATFKVDQSNREAFEICRAVADLRPVAPMPALLLGDDGCGKTHLLYSVVNQIRSGSARTGLAYVTAREFPDKVRGLIKDPTPVQRAASAILMVDQLEKFNSLVDELEAVVRIFLDNGHYVLVASSVHPGRLRELPRSLADLVTGGQIIHMKSGPAEDAAAAATEAEPVFAPRAERPSRVSEPIRPAEPPDAPIQTRTAVLEAELRQEREGHGKLRLEVETLRKEFTSARAAAETLRRDFDTLRREHDALQRDYDTVQTGHEIMRRENDSLRRDTDKTRQEREAFQRESEQLQRSVETLQQQLAVQRKEYETLAAQHEDVRGEAFAVAELRAEVARLQEEFLRLEAEREAGLQERDRLGERLERMQEMEDELDALRRAETELRRQLGNSREESEGRQLEANRLMERAESILGHVEEQRKRFAETEEHQREQLRALEAQLAQQTGGAAGSEELESAIREREVLRAELEHAQQEWSATREQLAVALRAAQNETANQDDSRKAALDKINRLTAEYAAMQLEVVDARNKMRALGELESKLADTQAQLTGLPALCEQLDVARARAAELENTERELATVRGQLAAAQADLKRAEDDVQARTAELEQARQTATQLEADVAQALDQAVTLEAELVAAREMTQGIETQLEAAKTQLAEMETLRAELAHVQESLRLDAARHAIEMDSLRHEAVAQVAAANAQAGDVQREYARLCAIMDSSRQTGHVVASELNGLQTQLLDAATAIEKLTGQLAKATEAETAGLASAPAPREDEGDFLHTVMDMNLPGLDEQVFFEAPSEPEAKDSE